MSLNLPGIKLFDLTGKSAVVTGGSKGLGLAMEMKGNQQLLIWASFTQ